MPKEKIKKFLQQIFPLKYNDEKTHIIITLFGIKLKLKYYHKATNEDIIEYIDYVQNKQLDKSDFINLSNNCYKFKEQDVKLISFYLPQFHDFEENIEPIIIENNRSDPGGAIPEYIYDFSKVLKIEPQRTMEYYNPETGDKVVI